LFLKKEKMSIIFMHRKGAGNKGKASEELRCCLLLNQPQNKKSLKMITEKGISACVTKSITCA